LWSKDILSFARVGEEQLIDAIPVSEIKSVEGVGSKHLNRVDTQLSSHQISSDVEIAPAQLEGKR
jgi:hypothetical protein